MPNTQELNDAVRKLEAEHRLALQRDYLLFAKVYGILALRVLIIANGGAVVAVMAFLANVIGHGTTSAGFTAVAHAILWFVWGTACAVAACAFAYVNFTALHEAGPTSDQVRDFVMENKVWTYSWVAKVVQPTAVLSLLAGVMSCALLVAGAYQTAKSFDALASGIAVHTTATASPPKAK